MSTWGCADYGGTRRAGQLFRGADGQVGEARGARETPGFFERTNRRGKKIGHLDAISENSVKVMLSRKGQTRRRMIRKKTVLAVLLSILTLVGTVLDAAADARTDYLIEMLRSGANYRVRVQAATALGQLRAKEAVPHLVKALEDSNELVVITAATALGQIGDSSVAPALRYTLDHTKSAAVKSQVASTLRVLEALAPPGQRPTSNVPAWVLVRVDAMGNSSGVARPELPEVLRRIVVDAVKATPGAELQPDGLAAGEVRARLSRDDLQGYIISGSVLRLERVGDKLYVKVSLNVFTNPDYNLLMMPSAEAAVGVSEKALTREAEIANQDKTIRIVAEKLAKGIFETLQSMASQ